jgi:hypothetical protein
MTQTETQRKETTNKRKEKEREIFPVMVTSLNKMCEM